MGIVYPLGTPNIVRLECEKVGTEQQLSKREVLQKPKGNAKIYSNTRVPSSTFQITL